MSGPANAASEDLAAPSEGKPVAEIHSQSKRKPDAENHSEGYEKPVTESEIEQVPEIPSRNETQSERDPVSEIHFTNKREPIAQIPSQSRQVKEPAPDIPSTSKGEPRLKEIHTESERHSHADSDDGQPQRWNNQQEWLNYIKEDLHVRPTSRSDATIFKIPNLLKDTKREAYVPQMVSLGPYHHESAELSSKDHYKVRALLKMMAKFNEKMRLGEDDFAKNAWNAILQIGDKIKCSYYEGFHCAPNTLAGMLCLDGCFILEVLKSLGDHGFKPGNINDPIFGKNRVAASNSLKDILMLENQIPWIVLLELLRLENPKEDDARRTLLNLMVKGTCGLFKISSEDRTALLELWPPNKEFHHLLGFVHNVIVYRPPGHAKGEHRIPIQGCVGGCLSTRPDRDEALDYDFESIPPAVELKNAGIKFRPCNGGIWKITFDPDSSTIYLPMLSIAYNTEVLFRNLMAFEMCRESELPYVNSYVNLMDDLIDSQNDVAFLRKRGILKNRLRTDKEVADLFNGLFKGVTVGMPNIFDELRRDVNANYKSRIRTRVQLPELLQDHFSSPWKTLAVAVAFAILCLTLLQTIYTVKN